MTSLNAPGARALLIGTESCAANSKLPRVPAVEGTLNDLRQVLIDRCGVPEDRISPPVLNPVNPTELGTIVAEMADQAGDVLFVYYVGHGLVSAEGELYLATRASDTRPNRLAHTSLAYTSFRDCLLHSPARSIVVVLDCCFSGRAIAVLGDASDLTGVRGGYVLTSAAPDQFALAPEGERHTAFTGEMIRLLTEGDPDGPPTLTIRHAYKYLQRALPARGFPRPHQRASDSIQDLELATNPAYVPDRPTEPVAVSEPTKPETQTTWQKKGVLGLIAVIVALGIIGTAGRDWAPFLGGLRGSDEFYQFGLIQSLTPGVTLAGMAARIAYRSVPPVAGATVIVIAGIGGFLIGGGAGAAATFTTANFLRTWISPTAAIWTSVVVMLVLLTIARRWIKESEEHLPVPTAGLSQDQWRQATAERRRRMRKGDDLVLPPRDRGPVRAYARDIVDSRRHLIGMFQPLIWVFLLVFLASVLTRNYGVVHQYVAPVITVMLYAMFAEAALLARSVNKKVRTKFPESEEQPFSLGLYAFYRAIQFRSRRVPGPRVTPKDSTNI